MNKKKYLVLLIDRERARMFTFQDGAILRHLELTDDEVPQKVKNGENAWDAQDKIFRHIEDHLHRHIARAIENASNFVKYEKIHGVLIGGHRPLFSKVEKELKYPLSKRVNGNFVTELKVSQAEILRRVILLVEKIEKSENEEELQQALAL